MKSQPDEKIELQSAPFPSSVAVLIPAWQPSSELVSLVRSLIQSGCNSILVVDDGSHVSHQPVFQNLQSIPAVHLLRHARNTGKGSALKTGIRYFLSTLPNHAGVVTADADGQHAVGDITRVATALAKQPHTTILGARRPVPRMPLRSRFGNALTRHVFRAATGIMLADTQTGLRGFPKSLLPQLLAVHGERYEYEMAVLLHLCSAGHLPVEVPIRTIYSEHNRSSHFRPLRDSAHVYKVLARHTLECAVRWKRLAQEQLAPRNNIS